MSARPHQPPSPPSQRVRLRQGLGSSIAEHAVAPSSPEPHHHARAAGAVDSGAPSEASPSQTTAGEYYDEQDATRRARKRESLWPGQGGAQSPKRKSSGKTPRPPKHVRVAQAKAQRAAEAGAHPEPKKALVRVTPVSIPIGGRLSESQRQSEAGKRYLAAGASVPIPEPRPKRALVPIAAPRPKITKKDVPGEVVDEIRRELLAEVRRQKAATAEPKRHRRQRTAVKQQTSPSPEREPPLGPSSSPPGPRRRRRGRSPPTSSSIAVKRDEIPSLEATPGRLVADGYSDLEAELVDYSDLKTELKEEELASDDSRQCKGERSEESSPCEDPAPTYLCIATAQDSPLPHLKFCDMDYAIVGPGRLLRGITGVPCPRGAY